MKNSNNDPKPFTKYKEEEIDISKIKYEKRGLDLKDREGVFAHSFTCQHCGLHFNIYSWKPNRHRVDNTYCPECGQQKLFVHHRLQLSENQQFTILSLKGEIFNQCPIKGSSLMSDTTIPHK